MSRVALQRWALLILLLTTLGSGWIAVRPPAHRPSETAAADKASEREATQKVPEVLREPGTWEPITVFTGVLALLTFFLVAVSLFQITYLARADRTAAIMASLARRSADTLDQTMIQTSRAFVFVVSITHTMVESLDQVHGWNFQIMFKNTGRTPTASLDIRSLLLLQVDGRELRQEVTQGGMIGPDNVYLGPLHFVGIDHIRRAHLQEIEASLIGYCRYKTVFSDHWETTEFGFFLVPIQEPFHKDCRFRFPALDKRNTSY